MNKPKHNRGFLCVKHGGKDPTITPEMCDRCGKAHRGYLELAFMDPDKFKRRISHPKGANGE